MMWWEIFHGCRAQPNSDLNVLEGSLPERPNIAMYGVHLIALPRYPCLGYMTDLRQRCLLGLRERRSRLD